MKYHTDYDLVAEALADEASFDCIMYIQCEQRALRIIGVDEEVLREAAELHPGADRELVRAFFTYRPDANPDPG